MISLKEISKTYRHKGGDFKALDSVSLDIAEGDIVGIIGSSGAGKSTLVRCMNLLERPDSGQIIIHGKDLAALSSKALAKERKNIGMIFQHFNLLSSRTVFDNIALPLELSGVGKQERTRKVLELLELVKLEDKSGQYPNSLSGGQKQRVAIARALANDPNLLLCDEATSALDPATTQSILQLLREINQRLRITILLITHEMDVVKSICNHVAVLDHGRLVENGTVEQILTASGHPLLRKFLNKESIMLPQELYTIMKQEPSEGLSPLIEIELTGNFLFEKLIDDISRHYQTAYNLIKADIEYSGRANFGKLLLHLQGSAESNDKVIRYFNHNNIKNSIRGYA